MTYLSAHDAGRGAKALGKKLSDSKFLGLRTAGAASAAASCVVSVGDCAGLEALPALILEDTTLSFDGTGAIVCDKVCKFVPASRYRFQFFLAVHMMYVCACCVPMQVDFVCRCKLTSIIYVRYIDYN